MTGDDRNYEPDTEVRWQATRDARRAAARARQERARERRFGWCVAAVVILASAYLVGHIVVALLR